MYYNSPMSKLSYLIRRITRMDTKAMRAKIKDIHEKSGKSRVWIFFDMVHCGRKFGAGYMDYWLYEMYNLTDAERDTYITRGRNYELVKRYNDPAYTDLIDNKIEFNKRFGDFLGRKWIEIRKDNKQEVIDFINDHDILFAKADLGSCGKTVEKIDCKAEKAEDIYERLVNQERPHFFEEAIVQHPAVSAIYPYAINTVRLVTIQRDGKVHVASACCRFGNYGHSVDNFNNGGMTAPVDEKTGEITDFPIDKTKVLYEKHPMTGAVFKGFVFPMWDKVLEMCTKAAMVVPQVGFIGWDVCITPDGPVIVEGNDYPGHDLYQLPEHTHDKKGIWPKYQF